MRGLQLGLCIVNPNNFPIYARVAAISTNVEKSSGSYANQDADRVWPMGRYSSNTVLFSDPMAIGGFESAPHTVTLQATVEYGRDKDRLDKQMRILADFELVQDSTGDVVGVAMKQTPGMPPNSYDLVEQPQFRQSRCRKIQG
jgi:hypothetical protein